MLTAIISQIAGVAGASDGNTVWTTAMLAGMGHHAIDASPENGRVRQRSEWNFA